MIACLAAALVLFAGQAPERPTEFDSGAIHGRVLESRGRPLAGARVAGTLNDPPAIYDARSDEEGRYEMRELTPGLWRVLVERDGYEPSEQDVRVNAGDVVVLDIVLTERAPPPDGTGGDTPAP